MSFAGTNHCRVILEDPLLRNQESLEKLIFADGDRFVFQNMKDKIEHGEVFVQNKEKIFSILEKQETRFALIEDVGFNENVYVIHGGESRLGRIAQKVWSLYGVKMVIDFDRLRDAAGSYYSLTKSIVIGLEDVLYPNQLSKTLWHEVIHAKNDFHSLVSLMIADGMDSENPYPSFHLDELIAYEKNLRHLNNSKLLGQRVVGERKNIQPRLYSYEGIIKDLSQRTLVKKKEILSLQEHLKSLEKNPKIAFQKLYVTLDFVDLHSEVKVFTSGFLKDSLGSVPERYLDFFPHLRDYFFKGSPEEFRRDFLKRTRYSIDLISKALEIAEKHAGEPH